MATSDTLYSNLNKVAYTNYWPTDKVIYSSTNTYTATNTTNTTTSFPIVVDLNNNPALPFGIYSTDGGITWTDIAGSIGTETIGANPTIVYLPVSVTARYTSNNNTLTIRVLVNTPVGGGSTLSVIVSVGLLSFDSNTTPMNIPNVSSSTTKTATTSITPSTNEPVRYRNIILSGALPQNQSVSILHTTPHNMGTIPDIAIWQIVGSQYGQNTIAYINDGANTNAGQYLMYVDSTNIYWWDAGGVDYDVFRAYKP